MTDRDRSKRMLLRTSCVVAAALGFVMLILGGLPGVHVYRDANDCFGTALGGLFAHGDPTATCEPALVLSHVERVLDAPMQWIAVLLLLAPGALVWLRPRVRFALLWSLLTIPSGYLLLIASFDLHLFDHVVHLWPYRVFGVAAVALFALLLLVVPVASGAFAWIHRDRTPPPPTLPTARVIKT